MEEQEDPKIVERRMAVIQDAVDQIVAARYYVRTGEVVTLPDEADTENHSAQEMLLQLRGKEKAYCKVCARGALLLSKIVKENEFDTDQLAGCTGRYGEDGITDKALRELFSAKQLALIEEAFEFHNEEVEDNEYYIEVMNREYLTFEEALSAHSFSVEYNEGEVDESIKLLAIFNNMLKNNGIFKP